jgi:hypothetical protein
MVARNGCSADRAEESCAIAEAETATNAASKQNRVVRVTSSPGYSDDDNTIDSWRKIPLMNTNSISATAQALRTEIELIQLHELSYRRSNDRSIPARNAHHKRVLRLLEIRTELLRLQKCGVP